MSVKRMITKLALAFAAKKGMDVLRSAGGIQGLAKSLSSPGAVQTADSGMLGRIGGAREASAGGLGNILGSLGIAGATDGREAGVTGQASPLNQSLGQIFGNLAATFGGNSVGRAHKLDEEFDGRDVDDTDEVRPIVMAMVQMARADGNIDDAEQRALLDFLDDATEEEQRILREALNNQITAEQIAEQTPHHARKEVYAAALLVGDPDNPQERAFLNELGSHLQLSEMETNRLQAALQADKTAA
ncbi:tellurite resistance TerB family protein [uncultured Roseobacter sp.]|nr:tellurite resistance TerB family protein [uncultured Roseobacter sp.]